MPDVPVRFSVPGVYKYLIESPARYLVAYGGRGSGKTENIAQALLKRAMETKHRILCCREFQSSIRDSVHKTLADQISQRGLELFYDVQAATIKCRTTGSEFIFKGLRHNVAEIKSTAGITLVWCEEAQAFSKRSWEVLIPTIREPGSQFYISFNPELESDDTYQRFVVDPPLDAVVKKVNHDNNPFFPAVLEREMAQLKERDYDAYLTVYEGHTRQTLDGAVYAKEIRDATQTNRITSVPYDPAKPVSTFWDLGRADMTAIWFAQIVGFEFRIIDYYENSGHALAHYLKELQSRAYIYGDHWLPHDAEQKLLAAERTISQQMRDVMGKMPRIVPKLAVANQISAARAIFPLCWFDKERTADGMHALRHFQFDVDPETNQRSPQPLHNWASHGAAAFQYLAVALKEVKKPVIKPYVPKVALAPMGQGWMG